MVQSIPFSNSEPSSNGASRTCPAGASHSAGSNELGPWSFENEAARRSQGEIEAAICERIGNLQQEYLGRGPKEIRAHLLGDLLVVRLKGVLTASEVQLTKTNPAENGRSLIKSLRSQLVEMARPRLDAIVEEATSVKAVSLHHDISTLTGEEVMVFTLSNAPTVRPIKKAIRPWRNPGQEGPSPAV